MNKSGSSRVVAACLLLAALVFSNRVVAQSPKRAAVLEFELASSVKSIDRIYLSDRARTALHDAAPGIFVMTRESTEALLQANGKTMADCTGECEVEVGRKLGADYIVSGRITQFGSRTSVTMRLFATADGQLLSSAEATGKSADDLFDGMNAALAKLLAPLAGSAPMPAARTPETVGVAPSALVAAGAGTLKVVSTPSGAKVSIDGDAAGSTPLVLKKDPGTYVVTLELPGRSPVSRTVEVVMDKPAVVNEALLEAAGYLQISIQPEAAASIARVTVDGKPAGTGKQGPYKVGPHLVRAEASGYRPAEASAPVENGTLAPGMLVLVPLPGKLLLTVNVAASCSAGTAKAQATPDSMVKLEVDAGRAQVTCVADGYEDASAQVEVGPGKAQAVKLSLKRFASGEAGGGYVEPKSGLEFVRLPGGVLVGGNFAGTKVAPFSLGRTATTTGAYSRCIVAGNCTKPGTGPDCNWLLGRNDHPINCVDWDQAVAFCRWIGGRLPKAEEREWAASGGEGRDYPWGSEEPSGQVCWNGDGNDVGKHNRKTTCPVGAHPAGRSKQGLLDLAGNVWEWLDTDYNGGKGVRGGSWGNYVPTDFRASEGNSFATSSRDRTVGFRCAL